MTPEIKAILESHKKWLDGEGGDRADLRSADLRSADLRSADLRSADLSRADLSGADLSGADLRSADLSRADLGGADLRSADLSRADLGGADLRSADLGGANLGGATYGEGVPIDKEPIQIFGLPYVVIVFARHIKIGCQIKTTEEWKSFSRDSASEFESGAEFFDKYRGLVLEAAKVHQAKVERGAA